MCLYDALVKISFEKRPYYENMPWDNIIENLTDDNAYDYIINYYKYGRKERIFDVGFNDKFKTEGKHMHTVVLYYMGCIFSDLIDSKLKSHIQNYIKGSEWYDFCYTWFLTCLYHDTATVIEKEDWTRGCPSDLDFYLGKYNIQYNFFEHNWKNSYMKPYTYPETLIKNYFKYRVEYTHSIDHGIIAGYLLYDRLVKNYNTAWREYSNENQDANRDRFYHKNLCWCIGHLGHFAIIADAIVAHNIWFSDNEELYKQFGLDDLIIAPENKLTIKENPLVYFLGLFDTIEPIKKFRNSDCLRHFKIDHKEVNSLEIEVLGSMTDSINLNNWFRSIREMENWLSIEIKTENEEEYPRQIKVNIE